MSKSPPKSDEVSFEDAMQRLDEIVAEMEDAQPTLEDMISSYEEGVRLLKLCRQRIDGARRRVELISGDLDGSKASLTPFDGREGDADAPQPAEKNRPSARRRKPEEEAEGGTEIRLF